MSTLTRILPDGKYAVKIMVHGKLTTVLIKYIKGNRGENHVPGPLSRFFKLSGMGFDIKTNCKETTFTYDNGLMVDKLKWVGNKWLGQIYLRNVYAGLFILKRM